MFLTKKKHLMVMKMVLLGLTVDSNEEVTVDDNMNGITGNN